MKGETQLVELVNGLVRPLSAICVIVALVWAFIAQTMGWSNMDIKDAFIGVGGGIIGWYFGKRDAEKERAGASMIETSSVRDVTIAKQ